MARIQERSTAVNTFRQFVVTPSLYIQILYSQQITNPTRFNVIFKINLKKEFQNGKFD